MSLAFEWGITYVIEWKPVLTKDLVSGINQKPIK